MPVECANSGMASLKDDPIIDILQREYVLLQGKIDKIGEFRFTIKGWALTLNTGALVAAFSTSLYPKISIPLVSLLALGLWLQEQKQARLTDIFQSRSLRIENKIMRRLRSLGVHRQEFSTLICSPGIANELRTPIEPHRPSKAATSALGRKRTGVIHKIVNSTLLLRVRRSRITKRLSASDVHFYILLWAISVSFLLFQGTKAAQSDTGQSDGHVIRTHISGEHSAGRGSL